MKGEYDTPSAIRGLLIDHTLSSDPSQYPGFFRSIKSNISFLTSWATLKKSMELENCRQLLHMPVSIGDSSSLPVYNYMVVYKIDDEKLAITIVGRSLNAELLSSQPILNGKITSFGA
jgi:hypothetical protein